MTNILKPYLDTYIAEHKLETDQKAILFIDVYPVHTGNEFWSYVFKEFPNVFLIFVPGNCGLTFNQNPPNWSLFVGIGIFQPADVGVQKVAKQFICHKMLDYLVDRHKEQLAQGLTPDKVKFTTSMPELRKASVLPIVELYKFLSGPLGREVVQRVSLEISLHCVH